MKRPERIFLVADGSRARLLTRNPAPAPIDPGERKPAPLLEIAALEAPMARAKAADIMADRQGRSFESATDRRSAMAYPSDPKEVEQEKFTHEIARELDRRVTKDPGCEIVLIADPQTLGALRKALGAQAADRVILEIDKDLTRESVHELAGSLADHL